MDYDVKFADISVGEDGIVCCKDFEDIYFDMDSGINESRYLFLEGNRLPERLRNCEDFNIVETGFGTGLNFLNFINMYQSGSYKGKINYFSVEKFPVKKLYLSKLFSMWRDLEFRDSLLNVYPQERGSFKFPFCEGKVILNLYVGDIENFLETLNMGVQCWFLDGFSPLKNPEMWSNKLFNKMGEITVAGGTFSSFTAAGSVKRGLRSNGFFVKRFPGFGKKRHMIAGFKEPV